jgi:Trp operon repressor
VIPTALAIAGMFGTILALVYKAGRQVESMQKDIQTLTLTMDKLEGLPERVKVLEIALAGKVSKHQCYT